MRIFQRCQGCNKRKLFTKQWHFRHKAVGIMKNKSDLCFKCYLGLRKLIKKS